MPTDLTHFVESHLNRSFLWNVHATFYATLRDKKKQRKTNVNLMSFEKPQNRSFNFLTFFIVYKNNSHKYIGCKFFN